jgi:hypothetical protein
MSEAPEALVVIRTYQVEHHAELARAVLEANEIRAVVLRDNAGGMLPVLQVYFPIRLAVPRARADAALAILDAEDVDELAGAAGEPPDADDT